MSTSLVNLTENVKKERLHIKVQGFVVEEEFSNEA